MRTIFSLKLIFLALFLSVNIFANTVFQGKAKQDVNVRSMPDYESKVAYVLKKNQDVNIQAIIKTKNKGTWYKIDNGYVVLRFIETSQQNIPIQTYKSEIIQEVVNQIENSTENSVIEIEEKVLNVENKAEAEEEPKDIIVQDIEQTKEEEITNQIKPIIQDNDETLNQKVVASNEEIKQVNTYIEPVVIKKEESFISKYLNIDYILYGIIGIIVFVLLIVFIGKIFSRPSISDQISQHQKRNAHLKKALSKNDED